MNRHLIAGLVGSILLTVSIIAVSAAAPSMTYSNHSFKTPIVLAAEAHPRLLRALHDLRSARSLLANNRDESRVDPNEDRALRETNQAITEVALGIKSEGGGNANTAPSDVVRGRDERLNAALRFLRGAFEDLNIREDENPANAWRTRALGDVRDAIHFTELALGADRGADMRCRSLRKAFADLGTTREDLTETLAAFGSNHSDAYNDTLQIRNRVNDTLSDLAKSIDRQCGR